MKTKKYLNPETDETISQHIISSDGDYYLTSDKDSAHEVVDIELHQLIELN